MSLKTRRVTNDQEITSPRLGGEFLFTWLEQSVLVLLKISSLKHGAVHRGYRRIQAGEEPCDLTEYSEIYNSQRQLLAVIESV